MNQNTRPLKDRDIIGACRTLDLVHFLVGKRVRVTFSDTSRRDARLTRLHGHDIKVNGQPHVIVDALELDGEVADLAEMSRIVRIDNLEAEVQG